MIFGPSFLQSFLTKAISHCEEQHAILSRNVANINTPCFRAKTLQPFALDKTNKAFGAVCTKTHDRHISVCSEIGNSASVTNMNSEQKPNGNDVNLLEQNSAISSNSTKHALLLSLLNGIFDIRNSVCKGNDA
ncbi:flagellar basal body rod protein FlgB [Candidatus Sneabacter namystus]|uniref:Flagellar basal body rod protein FlgB n=1 Tax=Candidatus Sneabacter namystus TaxID=2601646 RepID=A0A5C0UHF7_9RICK|nr:hypothetical protein [Candidatus Sneabacter namystus]QEK39548.1 hypothetical protein FZC37_01170 [Candidatus Sneabacter namystus]